jgi:hypothetical protein
MGSSQHQLWAFSPFPPPFEPLPTNPVYRKSRGHRDMSRISTFDCIRQIPNVESFLGQMTWLLWQINDKKKKKRERKRKEELE